MGDTVETVRALDVKIAETEQEFERLSQLLAKVESNLQVLRKARNLLVGESGQARPSEGAVEAPSEPPPGTDGAGKAGARTRLLRQAPREAQPARHERGTDEEISSTERTAVGSMSGPINTMILEIIREAGKPLHTTELVERLHTRGKDADPATVTNAIAHLVRAGKLWRTAPDTFGLPKGVGL